MTEECHKRRYSSREKARNLLRGITRHPGGQGFRARIYYCDICRAYHVTNHEKSYSTTRGASTKKQKKRRLERKRKRRETSQRLRNWEDSCDLGPRTS